YLREKIATLDAEIKQMEETEAYSEVLHKLSYKKAKAKELAFEWAAMKLATDTLEQTKKSFHQKYMNDVIEKASHYFRSEEHTSELQSRFDLVCRLLLDKKNRNNIII